ESTGAAHPMETIDAITEVSMYQKVELRSVVTVVDGEHLLHRSKADKSATYRLMQDQIRCASLLVLNKSDRLHPEEIVEVQQLLRELNEYAELMTTSHCQLKSWLWLDDVSYSLPEQPERGALSALTGEAAQRTGHEATDND